MKPGKYYKGGDKIIYIYLNNKNKQRGIVIERFHQVPYNVGDIIVPIFKTKIYKEITNKQEIKRLDKKRILMII